MERERENLLRKAHIDHSIEPDYGEPDGAASTSAPAARRAKSGRRAAPLSQPRKKTGSRSRVEQEPRVSRGL
jgi:hypothetical protein